jgi:hypothetical protein
MESDCWCQSESLHEDALPLEATREEDFDGASLKVTSDMPMSRDEKGWLPPTRVTVHELLDLVGVGIPQTTFAVQ